MEPTEHRVHAGHREGPGYETSDAKPRPLLVSVGLIAAVTAGCMIFLVWMMGKLWEQPESRPVAEAANPYQMTNLYLQRDRLQRDESKALDEYGYDRKTGAARIPIERAMDLIAERGVPKGKGPRTEVQLNSRDQEKGQSKP